MRFNQKLNPKIIIYLIPPLFFLLFEEKFKSILRITTSILLTIIMSIFAGYLCSIVGCDLSTIMNDILDLLVALLLGLLSAFLNLIAGEKINDYSIDRKYLNLDLYHIVSSPIILENYFQKFAPETWNQTRESFLDTIEAFPDELERWKERNLKYVAYLVVAWDLLGFIRYFITTAISNAITKLAEGIATRKVSS